jgi:hypothetical protein
MAECSRRERRSQKRGAAQKVQPATTMSVGILRFVSLRQLRIIVPRFEQAKHFKLKPGV